MRQIINARTIGSFYFLAGNITEIDKFLCLSSKTAHFFIIIKYKRLKLILNNL